MKKSKKPSSLRHNTVRTPVREKRKDPIAEYKQTVAKDEYAHIVTLGSEDCSSSIKHWFSTGSLRLDWLLNHLGIPAGRVTEVFGPPHIGKSTLLDHIMALCQRAGGIAVLADSEFARDVRYTKRIGVDPSKLQLLEFDRGALTVENVLDKINMTAEFWAVKYPELPVVVGFDALGGTQTEDERDKKLGATEGQKQEHGQIGGAAKILRRACRKLLSIIANTKIAVIICNHEYQVISTGPFKMAKKRETYGGEAIRLAASIRLELFNLGNIKRGEAIVGRQVGAKLIKNRLGRPWEETSFALIPSVGIDNTWELFEGLKERGVITVEGSWASVNLDGEILKFQGWGGFQAKCSEDVTLFPRLLSVYVDLLKKLEVPDAPV